MTYATSHKTVAEARAAIASNSAAQGYLRQTGEAFKAAQGKFFISAAAVWLYMGDQEAREAAKATWADSKDKAREYALKVFRACAAAATAGHANDIAKVRTFAELQAFAPAKKTAPATDAPTDGAPTSEGDEAATPAKQPATVRSQVDALMAQFGRMQALEARLRTMSMNKKATAAQHRSEAQAMQETLETLRQEMMATFSMPGQEQPA